MRADRLLAAATVAAAALTAAPAFGAATIVIINNNAAGVGFNDTTPATPVGGNTGTTLGEQRLIAFQYAANIWGATLDSNAVIRITAQFTPLACTATGATLGSAGATSSLRNFTGATYADTWYPVALRNKLVGSEANPGTGQITANFNSRLGLFPDCLPSRPFYLGLDNKAGTAIDLVSVLLHEFGHGLGVAVSPTNGQTGARSSSSPSIWERFMFDNATGQTWFEMTGNAPRAASAISVDKLAWAGPNVVNAAPQVLRMGLSLATVSGPAAGALAGTKLGLGDASFGAKLSTAGVTGELMPVVDQADGTGLACDAFSAPNRLAVRGRIALVDRGVCNVAIKARNAQDAGAIGVVIVNDAAGALPLTASGFDPVVNVPVASMTLANGQALKQALQSRSRSGSGVFLKLAVEGTQYQGADIGGRVKLYVPNPFVGGSSVSHFDITAFPNLLMEPNINADLKASVLPPDDLTFMLLKDIGW